MESRQGPSSRFGQQSLVLGDYFKQKPTTNPALVLQKASRQEQHWCELGSLNAPLYADTQ